MAVKPDATVEVLLADGTLYETVELVEEVVVTIDATTPFARLDGKVQFGLRLVPTKEPKDAE